MRRWFAMSAIGRDRPGIVADLADLIYECDCNLEDSRMNRTAVQDVTLRGEIIRAGDKVLLLYGSANRDARQFPHPDVFDVGRHPNDHVAFGFGAHFCLGASLARLELRVMFDELLRRLPDIELATDDPLPRRPSNFIVGIEHMPVVFAPRG